MTVHLVQNTKPRTPQKSRVDIAHVMSHAQEGRGAFDTRITQVLHGSPPSQHGYITPSTTWARAADIRTFFQTVTPRKTWEQERDVIIGISG
jgi:hypothetical protein